MATDNYNQSGKNKGPFYLVIALVVVAALGLTAIYVAGSDDNADLSAIESAAGDNPAGGPMADNDLDGTPDNQEVGNVNAIVNDMDNEFVDDNNNGINDSEEPIIETDNPQNDSDTVAEEVYEDSIDAVQEAYEETEQAVEEMADDAEQQMEEDAEAAQDPNRPTASDNNQY